MKSPQIENGHLDLANELVDQFCRLNLCAGEWRVLWAILRKTYSWHKKTDRIPYSQFEKMTGLDRRNIARYLDQMIVRNIIIKTGNSQKLFYGLQKDYSQWKPLSKHTTVKTIVQTYNEPLSKHTTETIVNLDNGLSSGVKKILKETYKRKTAEPSRLPIDSDRIFTLDEILRVGKDQFENIGYNQFRLKQ